MKKYLTKVTEFMSHFKAVSFKHIPRSQNKQADRLARLASDDKYFMKNQLPISCPIRPSIKGEPNILICMNWLKYDWRSLITQFLKMGNLPFNRVEALKLKLRATQYTLIDDILYKQSFTMPYLRCLSLAETEYVMREVHEGICRNHFESQKLIHKLVSKGYYWPTMQNDSTDLVQRCDSYQRFANIPRGPTEELTPIIRPWPFTQWGIDIVGPLPQATRQRKFLVVAVDYFTKWVKAEALTIITEHNIRNFIWRSLICRFGIPQVIITNNKRQFDNKHFREFCSQLRIKNHFSSLAHP